MTTRSIAQVASLGTIAPIVVTTLADNETGDLRWNRPDRPEPESPHSSYRRIGCIGDGSCFFHAVSKGLSEVYQLSYREPTTISEETLRKLESSINYAVRFPSELFDRPRTNDPRTIYQIRRPPHYREDMAPAFLNLLQHFRVAYARSLRQDLANSIMHDPRMEQIVLSRYAGSIELVVQELQFYYEEQLMRGLVVPSGLNLHQQALRAVKDRMVQELLSGNAVQPDFMLAISDYVGVDIYLLRDQTLANPNPTDTPLYSGTSLHEAVHGPVDMRPADDKYKSTPNRRSIVIISINDYHYELVGRIDETRGPTGIGLHIYPNLSQTEPLIRQLYSMLKDLRQLED